MDNLLLCYQDILRSFVLFPGLNVIQQKQARIAKKVFFYLQDFVHVLTVGSEVSELCYVPHGSIYITTPVYQREEQVSLVIELKKDNACIHMDGCFILDSSGMLHRELVQDVFLPDCLIPGPLECSLPSSYSYLSWPNQKVFPAPAEKVKVSTFSTSHFKNKQKMFPSLMLFWLENLPPGFGLYTSVATPSHGPKAVIGHRITCCRNPSGGGCSFRTNSVTTPNTPPPPPRTAHQKSGSVTGSVLPSGCSTVPPECSDKKNTRTSLTTVTKEMKTFCKQLNLVRFGFKRSFVTYMYFP